MRESPENYVKAVLDKEEEELGYAGKYHCGRCWRDATEDMILAAMAEERKACKEIAENAYRENPSLDSQYILVNTLRRIEMREEIEK